MAELLEDPLADAKRQQNDLRWLFADHRIELAAVERPRLRTQLARQTDEQSKRETESALGHL